MLEQLLIVPIILPLLGAVSVAFVRGNAAGIVVLLVAGLTVAANAVTLGRAMTLGPQVYLVGGWAPPQGIVLVADVLGTTLALTASVLAFASALHCLVTGEQMDHPLYHAVFLLMLMALGGTFLTGDLFNLYVFMELAIISSIVLVAMAERPVSSEVTFKYAFISALASTALLFSIGLIYGGLGTLNMADIAQRVAAGEGAVLVPAGATVMLAVFLLKAGMAPFHFWLPDAHSVAPSPVSAMLSGVLVKVGIYGVIRIATLLFPDSPGLVVLIPIGVLSALFGGVAALANQDLKRILAYSTISNMGFIAIAIAWGGTIGLGAAVVNTVNHALIKGSLFLTVGYVVERYREYSLRRLTGLTGLAPGAAVLFGVGSAAIAGLPPTNGFPGKLMLFGAGLEANDYIVLGLAVVGGGLGIAYSTRAFVRVFRGETPDWAVQMSQQLEPKRFGLAAAGLLVVGVVAFGIWPSPLMSTAIAAANELGEPQTYILAVLGGER